MSILLSATLLLAGNSLQAKSVTSHENDLFKSTMSTYLTQDSWTNTLAYNAGQFLMVPLQAAFLLDQKDWQQEFENHFKRLVAVPHDQVAKTALYATQYLYLPSRFLALSARTGRKSDINEKLTAYVTDEVVDRWTNKPAPTWDNSKFKGLRERIQHKMMLANPPKSYYKAIIDEENFVFAEAADLLYVERKTGIRNPGHDVLNEIVQTALTIYKDRSEFTKDGGWLFDVGAWTDHPDMAYVGNTELAPGLSPKLVRNVTLDTSHFHRFPLLCTSLREAFEPGSSDYKFMDKICAGLAKQFSSKVLIKPDSSFEGYRTTNFVDGWNGVYRYGLKNSAGKDTSLGPYQLSGTFLMGWWSFLSDPTINAAYEKISKSFPLPESVLQTYMGPGYTDPPRKSKTWYENGMAELYASLGAKMPPFVKAVPAKVGTATHTSTLTKKATTTKKPTVSKPTKAKTSKSTKKRKSKRKHRGGNLD